MSAEERLITALKAGWVTRDQVCAILGEKDREARRVINRLKQEYPVMIGNADRPGYKIATSVDEMDGIRRTKWQTLHMIQELQKNLSRLMIFEHELVKGKEVKDDSIIS